MFVVRFIVFLLIVVLAVAFSKLLLLLVGKLSPADEGMGSEVYGSVKGKAVLLHSFDRASPELRLEESTTE